jgi:hypothetical protein
MVVVLAHLFLDDGQQLGHFHVVEAALEIGQGLQPLDGPACVGLRTEINYYRTKTTDNVKINNG